MKLKPTDHIIMFVERNDGIEEFFNDGWAQFFCKATKCDYIFLVDEIENADLTEIYNGVKFRMVMYPTSMVTFRKVKEEDGMNFKQAKYYRADGVAAL